jgi:prepilin-type N-terminal cleavage/methylation domain-containing protein
MRSRFNPQHRRRTAGFSLIEVTAVVVILGLFMYFALPKFINMEPTEISSAADLLASDLAFAQAESIAHGDDPRVLVINSGNDGYIIAATSAPATPLTDPTSGMPYRVIFGAGRAARMAGVSIKSFSLGGDSKLGFGSFGQLDQATNATITLGSAHYQIPITIDATTGESTISGFH